jgi:Flp pilus assembly protein TadD
MRSAIILATVAFLSAASLADIVVLHDGRKFEGEVLSPPNAAVVKIRTPMATLEFRKVEVSEVRLGPVEQPATQPASDPLIPSSVDPAAKAKYIEAQQAAERATTGSGGLAVWQEFLKGNPAGPLADLARQRMVVWKERADGNLVRFGPQWQPQADVEARQKKADELIAKAASAVTEDEGIRLLDQAAEQHPYRADIHLKKAVLLYKAKRTSQYGVALGEVLRLEPDNIVARNNIGVVYALQKQWQAACAALGKAAVASDDERVLDNLDQVVSMAGSGESECERIMQQTVAALQPKHRGTARWGDSWIKEDDYQRYQRENAEIDRRVGGIRGKLDDLKQQYGKLAARRAQAESDIRGATSTVYVGGRRFGHYETITDEATVTKAQQELDKVREGARDIEAQVGKLKDEQTQTESKRNVPTHAGKLIVLAADKSELDSISVSVNLDPGAKPKPDGKSGPPGSE